MPLTTYLVVAQPETHSTPLLAIALPQGEMIPSLRTLDPSTGGALGRLIASGDFSGKKDQVAVLYPSGIDYVLVNGQLVVDQGQHTGAKPGKVLWGPAWQGGN